MIKKNIKRTRMTLDEIPYIFVYSKNEKIVSISS